jgi:hypothetical protein
MSDWDHFNTPDVPDKRYRLPPDSQQSRFSLGFGPARAQYSGPKSHVAKVFLLTISLLLVAVLIWKLTP